MFCLFRHDHLVIYFILNKKEKKRKWIVKVMKLLKRLDSVGAMKDNRQERILQRAKPRNNCTLL